MKKILSILLLVCTLCATACSPSESSTETPTEEFQSEVLLNSFENYAECYDMTYGYGDKLTIDFIADKEIVTDGEKMARVSYDKTFEGKEESMSIAVPLFKRNDETKNYRDFSKMSRITYDVYNDSENEVVVSTSIMQKVMGEMYTNARSQTIAPKSKATITYTVNRYEIFYALGIKGPTHVNMAFSGIDSVVCVDNLRLHYTEEEFIAPETVIEQNEIIGFEKTYQSFVVYTTKMTYKAEILADMAMASEGNRCLKIRREGVENGVGLTGGGKFGISANYLSNINFDKLAKTAYIAFDYKMSWSGKSLWFVPRLVSVQTGSYANGANCKFECDEQWHTYYISFEYAPMFFDNIEISFDGTTFGDMYFDNFRIVNTLPNDVESKYIAPGFGRK